MPQPKKHPSTRARANRAATAATLVDGRCAVEVPDLPGVREWSDLTLDWWGDLWASPMSAEYHASDQHQVLVLAILMDDFFTAESRTMRTAISAEIRQHRMAFGMTPYDRRRLEWTIEQAEESKDRGAERRARRAPVAAPAGEDPRSALRAV